MKTYFLILALVLTGIMTAAVALAQPVDIGTGQMDHNDFETLKQLIGTKHWVADSSVRPVHDAPIVGELPAHDITAIRNAIEHDHDLPQNGMVLSVPTVDIGTGSIPVADFCQLSGMVTQGASAAPSDFSGICS